MKPAHSSHHKTRKNSTLRVGDWICHACNNYNYSFRVICNFLTSTGNRCSAQPYNVPFNCLKGQDQAKKPSKPKEEKQSRSIDGEDFPKVVFLMLGDEGGEWK